MGLYAYIDNNLYNEFIAKDDLNNIPYDRESSRNRFLKEVGTPRIVWEHDYIASECHFWYEFHYYPIPQGVYVKYNTHWAGYTYSFNKQRFIKG
jgi:hypothetical protein